jgi:hypothetical protein
VGDSCVFYWHSAHLISMLGVEHAGYCARTLDAGNCEGGDSGSWPARMSKIESIADCAARCLSCHRCEYVSFSAPLDDCSWYHQCDMGRLHIDVQGSWSFRTVRVHSAMVNATAFWLSKRSQRPKCPHNDTAHDLTDALDESSTRLRTQPRLPLTAATPHPAAPLLLLGLLSGSETRRKFARCTWLRVSSSGFVRHLFVVGKNAADRGHADVLEVPVEDGKHLFGQGAGEVVAARTLSGYLKMVHFTRYAVRQPESLIGMGDDDVFIQPRMLAAYAQRLRTALDQSPALYAGAFEYFSWRTRSLVATGWGRNLGEALFEAQVDGDPIPPTHSTVRFRPHSVPCRS